MFSMLPMLRGKRHGKLYLEPDDARNPQPLIIPKKMIVFDIDETLYKHDAPQNLRPDMYKIKELIMANKGNPDIDFFYYTNGDTWRHHDTLSNLIDNRKVFGLQDNPARYYSDNIVNPDCNEDSKDNLLNLVCTRKSIRQFVECLQCLYGVERFHKHIESNDLKILFFDDCELLPTSREYSFRIIDAKKNIKFKDLFPESKDIQNVTMTTIVINKYDPGDELYGSPDIIVSMNMFLQGEGTLNEKMITKIVENSYINKYNFVGLINDKQKKEHMESNIVKVEQAVLESEEVESSEGGSKIHKKLGYKYKTKRKRKISRRRSRRKVL